MKRTPLKRTRFKKKPARRIAARAEDQPFRDWLHAQDCVALEGLPEVDHWCTGSIEQSHGPAMGMGMKAPEAESWPACHGLHVEWEEHRGVFAGWSKLARREFSKAMSEATQARWRHYQSLVSRGAGMLVGESPAGPVSSVGPLKHPLPAGEVYYCPLCDDVDSGSPCRKCEYGGVLVFHPNAHIDPKPPF